MSGFGFHSGICSRVFGSGSKNVRFFTRLHHQFLVAGCLDINFSTMVQRFLALLSLPNLYSQSLCSSSSLYLHFFPHLFSQAPVLPYPPIHIPIKMSLKIEKCHTYKLCWKEIKMIIGAVITYNIPNFNLHVSNLIKRPYSVLDRDGILENSGRLNPKTKDLHMICTQTWHMHNKRIIYELSVRNIIFISIERTPNLKRTFREKIPKKVQFREGRTICIKT